MTIVLFFIGTILVLFGISRAWLEIKNRSFKPIKIAVKEFGIKEEKINQLFGQVTYYVPWMSYEYEINGQMFIKEDVRMLRERFADEYKAKQFANDILNSEIVYVDINSPSKPTIYRPANTALIQRYGGVIGAGFLLVVISVIIFFSEN